MRQSDFILLFHFSVFSGGSFGQQAKELWTSPPASVLSKNHQPWRLFQVDIILHVFLLCRLGWTTLCWSPLSLCTLSISLCRIKSSVSILAACQQRSSWATCLWKHYSLNSSLGYSNKEEHYRDRRVCLTSLCIRSEISILDKVPTHFK